MPKAIQPDFKSIFESAPGLNLILLPDLTIVAVSDAYLQATMTKRTDIIGHHLFEIFPDNPADSIATGVSNLRFSLNYVVEHKTAHTMAVQKYDIRRPDGTFEERYWSPINKPVLDSSNAVEYIIHRVEDITEFILAKKEQADKEGNVAVLQLQIEEMEIETYKRAQEIQQLNEQLLTEIEERKKAEDKLIEMNQGLDQKVLERAGELLKSKNVLSETLERITNAFVGLDNNWCYTYMNKKAGEIFNRESQTMIGKHIWTEFPEGINQPFHKAYYKAMEIQQYIYLEEYYAPYDLWFENHIYPSPDGLSIFFWDITEKKKSEEALKEKNNFIESIINQSPDIIYIYDIEKAKNIYVNEGIQMNLGYTTEEIKQMGDQVIPILMHPDDFDYYLYNTYPKYEALKDKEIITHEYRMKDKEGNWHWLLSKESIFLRKPDGSPKQIFGVSTDITEGKKVDLLLSGEKKVLEMIAAEKPLQEILDTVALNYESYSDNALCSILLLDDEGTHIRHGSGPSLPDAFNKGIEGEPIGPVAGSCGTAAYRKERVIVSDIATDPLWVNYRNFALGFGLKASWSTPIINTEGKVYGTFAIYYRECHTPVETDLRLIDRAANQVKIILKRYYNEAQIKESEEKYRTLVQQAAEGIFIADLEGNYLEANDSAAKLTGYSVEELKKMNNRDISDPEELKKNPIKLEEIKKGNPVLTELVIRRKDNTPVNVDISAKLMDNNKVIIIMRDVTERKKAEEELRLSESRTKKIFEAGMIGFIFWDANGEILDANDFFLEMTGYSKKDLTEKKIHWNKMTPPEYAELDRRGLEQIALTGICQPFEKEYLRKDGSRLQVLLGATSFDGNSPEKGVAYVMDITERKKAEQSLTESEEKYRTLVEQASDAIFIADTNGRFITVNTSACKLAQCSEEELLQMSFYDFAVMEDIQKNPFHFDELKEGKTVITERIMKRKDAVELNVEITAKLLSDGRLLAFVRDISERKKAEQSIRESERKLRLALDKMIEGVLMIDFDLKYIYLNDHGEIVSQYPKEELIGNKMTDKYPGVEKTEIFKALIKCLNEREPQQLETEFTFPDGNSKWFQVSLQPVEEGAFILYFDITERKKAEEAIYQLNQDLEQRVKERTAELEKTNIELEEINDLFVGREARIIELKEELEELKNKPRL